MASNSLLLRLPRELRDHIIAYVFEDFNLERVDFSRRHTALGRKRTPPLSDLPPICKTTLQLYYEATPGYLTRVTPILYNIEMTCWLRTWLATFPSASGYAAIRQVAFRNFHGPEQIKGYELIALCPNLLHLDIMLGDEFADPGTVPSLAISSLSSSVNAYESLDNIILMHQLHRLLKIPRLERLDFGFHDWETPLSNHRARQVMEWLRVKFRAQGREVHIHCRQMLYGSFLCRDFESD